jgi:hypothetical protein
MLGSSKHDVVVARLARSETGSSARPYEFRHIEYVVFLGSNRQGAKSQRGKPPFGEKLVGLINKAKLFQQKVKRVSDPQHELCLESGDFKLCAFATWQSENLHSVGSVLKNKHRERRIHRVEEESSTSDRKFICCSLDFEHSYLAVQPSTNPSTISELFS